MITEVLSYFLSTLPQTMHKPCGWKMETEEHGRDARRAVWRERMTYFFLSLNISYLSVNKVQIIAFTTIARKLQKTKKPQIRPARK